MPKTGLTESTASRTGGVCAPAEIRTAAAPLCSVYWDPLCCPFICRSYMALPLEPAQCLAPIAALPFFADRTLPPLPGSRAG